MLLGCNQIVGEQVLQFNKVEAVVEMPDTMISNWKENTSDVASVDFS